MLKKKELSHAQKIARKAADGYYQLKELFGDEWPRIRDPKRYGQRFHDSVQRGLIPDVRWAGRNPDRSNRYQVAHPSADCCADLYEIWPIPVEQTEAGANGVLPTPARLSSKPLQDTANSASIAISGSSRAVAPNTQFEPSV
jgi:hypothetical protein